MEARRNELLASVATTAAAEASTLGICDSQAEQIGAAVADALADSWGGQTIYFPQDASFKISPRERALLDAHRRGTTVASLARQYKMSEQGVRKLLRRAATRDRNLDQLRLFDPAP
ncbi:MAG: Mor transcription activator family protein [Stenotrophomonas sp.]|uniref:Mor transcription activator family protein n=1 Tax=Stenotrophomonas sp. TaxID=69392 RepID=UPI003D6D3B52